MKELEAFPLNPKMKTGRDSYCRACRAAKAAERRQAHPEKAKAQWAKNRTPEKSAAAAKRYHEQNPDYRRQYREKNKETLKTYHAERYQRMKEHYKATGRAWEQQNSHVRRALVAKRRATKLRATPAWADEAKMQEFYFAAAFLGMVTGEWHEVDHIVPLQGKSVCGLHCESNLRVTTRFENRSKGAQ